MASKERQLIASIKFSNAGERFGRRNPYDRIMCSHENIVQKVEYICQNPLRKELIQAGEKYPWLWREWVEGVSHGEEVNS
jgi:hypothetical protein